MRRRVGLSPDEEVKDGIKVLFNLVVVHFIHSTTLSVHVIQLLRKR